jgi:hypothetical protein
MDTLPEWFIYIPDLLTPEEQRGVLEQLRALDYEHDTFRGQRLKRSYAQFGHAYVSSGRKLTPADPLPAFLTELIAKGCRTAPKAPNSTSALSRGIRKERASAGTPTPRALARVSWP